MVFELEKLDDSIGIVGKFLGLSRKRWIRRFRLEIDSVTVIPLAIAFFLPDTIAVTYGSQM